MFKEQFDMHSINFHSVHIFMRMIKIGILFYYLSKSAKVNFRIPDSGKHTAYYSPLILMLILQSYLNFKDLISTR